MLRKLVLLIPTLKTATSRKPIGDLSRRQILDPSGGQAKRKWQAIQLMADPPHRPCRGRRQGKARVGRRRAIDKETPRIRADHSCHVTAAGHGKAQR